MSWGIVETNTIWKLSQAVYGFRQSPKWWSDERELRLREIRCKVGEDVFYLKQNDADSQVWMVTKDGDSGKMLGILCVYVDDFLVLAPEGAMRDALVKALTSIWEFGPERFLTTATSLTFLGIDWFKRQNGTIFLTQERFTKELLQKHGMANYTSITSMTMDKPGEQDDLPTKEQLTELQAHAGALQLVSNPHKT